MPQIIEYQEVLRQMQSRGFVSLYHNSGAFGFAKDVTTHAVGWIGPADATLRAEAARIAHNVRPPYEEILAKLLVRAWREHLPGNIWLMPMSHWAYEVDFASRAWMPQLLRDIGIDPEPLEIRNDGAAIEFADRESSLLERFARGLLENLAGSDFAIAFPGKSVLATLHHHKQIWWMTSDDSLRAAILSVVAKDLGSTQGQNPSGLSSG